MRALAEFIMRGRVQATLVVAGCAALPFLFWLGAAASCLVLLRRGLSDAAGILAWALLPALVWWYFGEPRTLMALLGSLGLAMLLRASESWVRVLLVSVALGLLYAVILGVVSANRSRRWRWSCRNSCRKSSRGFTSSCRQTSEHALDH